MRVAVLAVQGAFAEHKIMMNRLGIECIELRQKADLEKEYNGIILPGGESTVQGKLLKELGMFDHLQAQIRNGMPVLSTCAGLILLAERISNDDRVYFQTLPVTVKRNAYGRQLGSFFIEEELEGIGTFPMEFIRAPYIEDVSDKAQILARVKDHTVAVRYKNQIGVSFHPELTQDTRLHELFLHLINCNAYNLEVAKS